MKDEEIKLEEIEVSLTLRGSGEVVRGEGGKTVNLVQIEQEKQEKLLIIDLPKTKRPPPPFYRAVVHVVNRQNILP